MKTCQKCGAASITGLLPGVGLCQYHYNLSQFGQEAADNARTLADVVSGYLEAAEWADAPEGSRARWTKAARAQAARDVSDFVSACGPLFAQALACPGYSPRRFGVDFWLTRAGHGAGFWDRDELSEAPETVPTVKDRDGKPYSAGGRGDTLGDVLTSIAYGDSRHISTYAYASLDAWRGWLSFV